MTVVWFKAHSDFFQLSTTQPSPLLQSLQHATSVNETLGIVLSNPAFNLVGQGLALLIGDSPLPVLFQIDFVGDKNNRNVVLSTDLKILLTIFSFNLFDKSNPINVFSFRKFVVRLT